MFFSDYLFSDDLSSPVQTVRDDVITDVTFESRSGKKVEENLNENIRNSHNLKIPSFYRGYFDIFGAHQIQPNNEKDSNISLGNDSRKDELKRCLVRDCDPIESRDSSREENRSDIQMNPDLETSCIFDRFVEKNATVLHFLKT